MVGREGEAFSNRVVHYASSLRGTRQYWFKQRSWLIAKVDNYIVYIMKIDLQNELEYI